MSKAIFFDRDGTLIHHIPYLSKVEDVRFFDDTFDALRLIQDKGYQCFIVTNQSGVARGYFELEQVHQVHHFIQEQFEQAGLKPFCDIAIAPHGPDSSSPYRKPGGQMILDLISKWKLDPDQSFMIGDRDIDQQAGEAAGVKGVILFQDFPNLLSFAQFLS